MLTHASPRPGPPVGRGKGEELYSGRVVGQVERLRSARMGGGVRGCLGCGVSCLCVQQSLLRYEATVSTVLTISLLSSLHLTPAHPTPGSQPFHLDRRVPSRCRWTCKAPQTPDPSHVPQRSCRLGPLPCSAFLFALVWIAGTVFITRNLLGAPDPAGAPDDTRQPLLRHGAAPSPVPHPRDAGAARNFLPDSDDESERDGGAPGSLSMPNGPYVERVLREWMAVLGQRAAEWQWTFLGVSLMAVAVAAIGLLGIRVETDPQRLWVGPHSRAAEYKVG